MQPAYLIYKLWYWDQHPTALPPNVTFLQFALVGMSPHITCCRSLLPMVCGLPPPLHLTSAALTSTIPFTLFVYQHIGA